MLEVLGETLEAGAIIARGYRLQRVLGEGGMGVVWSAHEIATNRTVALKFLRAERESDPRNQQRFLREARAAMGITHPNVARVEAVLETEAGVPFMVMELLQGESLRQLLERRGMLTAPECGRIMVQVVDAVAAAHANGIVHRDLKPENIFLVNQSYVRVLDFGIAKRMAHDGAPESAALTSTGMLLGTPLYMAPEQIFGDADVDTRVDVWSLGIVIYECLAGRRPTDGDGFGPIIKRITTGDLLPLEQARRGLPGRISRMVGRMLTRKKDDRPTLAEVREMLATVAVMGDDLVPSARNPLDFAPTVPALPALPASTTAGIEAGRAFSDRPAASGATGATAPRKGWIVLIAAALAVLFGGTWLAVSYGPTSWRRTTASPGPPGTASGNVDVMLLLTNATTALGNRDGSTCLRDLDTYDRLSGRPTPASTDPISTYALSRGTCMALAGDCEGGKSLYARAYAHTTAGSNPTATTIAQATDSFAAQFCEGKKLSPRDELLRADNRLTVAAVGQRKSTPAECREWNATDKRLLPLVKPRDATDFMITVIPISLEDRTATCLAYAGACEDAFRLFRNDWLSKNPVLAGMDPKVNEQSILQIWATRSGPTPCKGKP